MSKSDRVSPPVDAQADLSARDRAEAAILRFNTNYNPNGGPPFGKRLAKVSLTSQQTSWEPPRVAPQGCRRGSTPGPSSRRGPGSSAWSSPTASCWIQRNTRDGNTKESNYGVFDTLDQELIDLTVYNLSQTETVFQKMRWVYTGQEPFKAFVHRMGSSARSLAVGDICFKNTLYQSIKPLHVRCSS